MIKKICLTLLLILTLALPSWAVGTWSYTEATNRVVVTDGTAVAPATFADFAVADRAGVATDLLVAAAPGNNVALTYAVRPVEDLAILVKCIVANKTAEADFIFITGKDWRGAAQTESIDVTAGNGSYTTTEYWSEITTLDCSDNAAGGGVVWADGDLSVTQDIWGVVWDYGGGQYHVDADLDVGDGGTSTFFRSLREQLNMEDNVVEVTASATLQLGYKNTYGRVLTTWHIKGSATFCNGGTVNIYGSVLRFEVSDLYMVSGTFNCNNAWFYTNWGRSIFITAGTLNFTDVYMMNVQSLVSSVTPNTFTRVWMNDTEYGYQARADITFIGSGVTDLSISDYVSSQWGVGAPHTLTVRDPQSGVTTPLITHANGVIIEQYTYNVHVADRTGTNLAGVVVDCEDQFGTAVWPVGTVTTAADGTIAEQEVNYKKWVGLAETLTTYSPHKFTFSKPKYETLTKDNVTVSKPIDWHQESQDAIKMSLCRKRVMSISDTLVRILD